MTAVVVAGSNNDNWFSVIDFSVPSSPSTVAVHPQFQGGCMVDTDATLAVAGNFNGGQVAVYDIASPASPVLRGMLSTQLAGIGAISLDGSRVLAGEVNGQRVALIDVANPVSPVLKSVFTTSIASIGAIALKGGLAVASGPNDLIFVVLDYANPASPSEVQFAPGSGGVFFGGSVTCDLDGTRAAVADASDGTLYLFDVSGGPPSLLGRFPSTQAGVFSISVSGATVAAASTNDAMFTVASFQNPASPTGTNTQASLGGGVTVKLAAGRAVAGAVNGTDVALFSVAGTTAALLGTVNSGLASIATLGYTSFTPVNPQPGIAVTPASLAFGPVRVNTTSPTQAVVLKNTGSAPLQVSGLRSGIPQYSPVPSGPLPAIAPGQSRTVDVTFTPQAVTSYPSALTMTTNDPAHPTVSVPLSGSGGFPHIVPPGPLDFGDVAVCLTHPLNAVVANTGPVPLHLASIAVSGAGFSRFVAVLDVPAGGNAVIEVAFKPLVTGPAAGTLSFQTDDPNAPVVNVALTGTGTPEPPPTVSVTPAAVDFGAVPLQYFAGVGVTVANTGPCEDLNVTLTVSGAAFTLTTGDPTTLPPTSPPLADTIAASTAKSYTVVFGPTATTAATGTLTITSDDPARPTVTVPLTGTGVTVAPAAIELILDRSGSMATAVTGGTRMTALQSAVSMFADLIIPDTGFAMGAVQFDTSEAELVPLADLGASQQAAITTGANSLAPRNLTSIGGGLKLGQDSLSASPMTRKVAVVFTDGYENIPPMIAAVQPAVLAAGTEVYAVGLGDPAYLSTAALHSLAASSSGKFFQTTDPLVLRKQFVEVLADAFRQNMAADPVLNVRQGVPLTIPVSITNCESRISFVLLWEDPAAQVQLTVRAPDGTTFGSGAGSGNRLARYVQRPGYRFFQITLPPGPHRTIGPRQLGQWQMLVNPVQIAGGTTRLSASVLVDSDIEIDARVQASTVDAPMSLQVALTHDGSVISGASVSAAVTIPLSSLAQLSTPAVRQRAVAADAHNIPASLQNLVQTATTTHQATLGKHGTYVVELPEPEADGVYHFEVTAKGEACGGVFQRYWSASVYVSPPAGKPGRDGRRGSAG
jgi:hypothetical protein